jgi:hypothetical protein
MIAASKGGVATMPACHSYNSCTGEKALMQWLRWVKKNNP